MSMPIPSDQLPIGEGLHPDGRPGANFYVDRTEIELLQTDGPEWKLEDARFLEEAIAEPDAIFMRSGHSQCLAYSVRPMRDPNEDESSSIPPRFGFVFVAFARLSVGGYVVFDWEWREEDADSPGHPVDWQTDFEIRTWQKI